jgi:hypothetical protein
MEISESYFKTVVSVAKSKFYLSCKQHIKLINLVATTALKYRMQFVRFCDSWLKKLYSWAISQISSVHKIYTHNTISSYWAAFKELTYLPVLNSATNLTNIHTNLNKTKLIAYPILYHNVGSFLNTFYNIYSTISPEISLALKNIDLDFIFTGLISYIKLNTLSHTLNSYTALAALLSKYNINLTSDLFQNPNSLIIPDVCSHNRNSIIITIDGSLVNRYTIVSAIASDVLSYIL